MRLALATILATLACTSVQHSALKLDEQEHVVSDEARVFELKREAGPVELVVDETVTIAATATSPQKTIHTVSTLKKAPVVTTVKADDQKQIKADETLKVAAKKTTETKAGLSIWTKLALILAALVALLVALKLCFPAVAKLLDRRVGGAA